MAFLETEDEALVRRTVAELAQGTIAKNAREADLAPRFPRANVAELASLGLLGVMVDAERGGAGGSAAMLAIACEELAAVCGATGAFAAVTNAWVVDPLAQSPGAPAAEEWLPKLLSGEAIGTFALFEDAVGADPFRVRAAVHAARDGTSAENDGTGTEGDGTDTEDNGMILSGTKDLVLMAGHADLALVVARGLRRGTTRATELWAVPTERDGVTWGGDDPKLGLRGLPTAPLYLVRVPITDADRIGKPGGAPEITRRSGQLLAIATAACAVGLARSALNACVSFATERVQFGSPIARYEAIQHAVAAQRVACDASRAMVVQAARLFDRDGDAPLAAEEANLHTMDLARQATRTAIRVHGGAGFMRDLPVERYARDVRTIAVLGRAPDVSRSLIGIHELQVEG